MKFTLAGIVIAAALCSAPAVAAPAKLENGKAVINATAGKVTEPFKVKDNCVIGDKTGAVVFEVEIPEDGDYVVWGSTCGFGGNADSFLLLVDDQEAVTCDIATHKDQKCHWNPLRGRETVKDAKYKLTKGVHKITLKGREPGVAVDKICVAKPDVKPE